MYKANNIKTNFEVMKYQDSKEIVSKDSYLSMQAIGKTDTKKILYYYALSKKILYYYALSRCSSFF